MSTTECTVHLRSINQHKAPGELWIRLCSNEVFICEFAYPNQPDLLPDHYWHLVEQNVTLVDTQELLAYVYSGDSGVCISTQRLFYNPDSIPPLTANQKEDGYVHSDFLNQAIGKYRKIEELLRNTTDNLIREMDEGDDSSGNAYSQEWANTGDHRYLIKVPNGQPTDIDRSIGRTVADFLLFNEFDATILRVIAYRKMDFTIIQLATTETNAGFLNDELDDLKFALNILYATHIDVRLNVYPDYHPSEDEYPHLNSYLNRCFQLGLPCRSPEDLQAQPEIALDDEALPA